MTKIERLERELAASKKALAYVVKHFCDLQGEKVTQRDVQEFLCNIQRIEGKGKNDQDA